MSTGLSFLEFLMPWVHFQQRTRKLYLSLHTITKNWHIASEWRAVRCVDHVKTWEGWRSLWKNTEHSQLSGKPILHSRLKAPITTQFLTPNRPQNQEPEWTRVIWQFQRVLNCQGREVGNSWLWGGKPVHCISTDSVSPSRFNFSSRLSDAVT